MGDPAKTFDTLSYAKKLQKAGFTQEQAEVQAETFLSIVQEQLVSKRDLKELETVMKTDIARLETDLKRDMKEMETGLRRDMKEMELSLTKSIELLRRDTELMKRDLKIWLGGTMGVAVSVLATIIIIFTHIH